MTTADLDLVAQWYAVPEEARKYAWRLMAARKPYEALRVLTEATGSAPRARTLVAWLARMIIEEATK